MELQEGQRVLIMGLAKSGLAAAQLLAQHGLSVCVNDRRERAVPDEEADALEASGMQVVLGGHPLSLLHPRPDFIVKNPGIPYTVPLVEEAVRLDIPIYTEIEVASWLTKSPIYAITGSNGKTTTTTLVGAILEAAGRHPVVAGNIGTVLSAVVERVTPEQPIVLEVSSFQLAGTKQFHPAIAALLNLYPAHLDYHGTFEAYADAKWQMFQNMQGEDVAVLNFDQAVIRERAAGLNADVVWFSREGPVPQGVFVRDGNIVVRRHGVNNLVLEAKELVLKGEHNLENALAATAISVWAGASTSDVADVLRTFSGIEHRLEFVREVEGVDYYNDSKATNPEAALRALRSFDAPIVWIAGGLNRGIDFLDMTRDLTRHVRAAVLLGQSAEVLTRACQIAGVPVIEQVADLAEAVHVAHGIAKAGEVVLLSPACASWDMFSSYEMRGSMFKDIVHTL